MSDNRKALRSRVEEFLPPFMIGLGLLATGLWVVGLGWLLSRAFS
jgi:hypothetical protein